MSGSSQKQKGSQSLGTRRVTPWGVPDNPTRLIRATISGIALLFSKLGRNYEQIKETGKSPPPHPYVRRRCLHNVGHSTGGSRGGGKVQGPSL